MSSEGQTAEQIAAAAAAAAANTWYNGVYDKPEDQTAFVGHLQNRGWDKLTPDAAAKAAAKAHREAEAHIGVPADRLIRLPKDAADVEGIKTFREKLGVPVDAKGYDFTAIKFADGTVLGEDFTTALGTALSNSNVAKDKAPEIAQAVVKFMESAETSDAAETAAKLATAKDALKANWGNNYNANELVAKAGFQAVVKTSPNVDVPLAVQALEKVIGYENVMEMFRNIGSRIGEDTFVKSTAPGQTGVMSKEQATATLAERLNDSIWADKLSKGDSASVREFDTLTRLMQ